MAAGLAQSLQGLCAQALNLISKFANQQVTYDAEATEIFRAFDKECDAQINGSADESKRQMWNRAHLKVCRIAALMAAADHPVQPMVQKQHAEWALALIRNDIQIMSAKINNGDVGADDHTREKKMISVLRDYVMQGAKSEAYGAPVSLHIAGIVPRRFIQMRLCRVSCFMHARNGSSSAIDQTLKSLMDNGYIREAEKLMLSEKHSYMGKAYHIVHLPKE